MQRGFGLLGVLFVGALALIVGALAYGAGVAAGQASDGAAAGTVVYPIGFWHPFGFGLFGFLFFILIVVLLVRAFAGPRRWGGHGGYGGWGHRGPGWGPGWGGWGPGGPMAPGGTPGQEFSGREVPPMFEPMLEKWHQRAHADPTAAAPGTTTPGASTPGAGTTGAGSSTPPPSPTGR